MNRKLVNVGVVGVGTVWETKYRPALARLQDRIQIATVSDSISARAKQAAHSVDADAVDGLLQMARRQNLHALLLLETGWRGNELLNLLLNSGKPVLVAEPLGSNLQEINRIRETVETRGLIVVPEFEHRYTPASGRFQELLATRLGQPHKILIDAIIPLSHNQADSQAEIELLANLFDWCHRIVRTAPVSLQSRSRIPAGVPSHRLNGSTSDLEVMLEYPQASEASPTIHVEMRLRTQATKNIAENGSEVPATASILYEAICEHGQVMMNSATDIAWRVNGEVIRESLTSDCSSIEVMLDHFCRRVVGGLIPIADLADVSRSVALALQVQESLQ